VTTATEIIAALLQRRPAPILEKRTGLPHGWGIWLRNRPAQAGQLSRAPVEALVAVAAARPRMAPGVRPMNRWQAAWSLHWQHGEAPPREERWIRWVGRLGSLLLHLAFLALLIFVSLMALPPTPTEEDGSRVQLTFIGRGTPGEGGGSGPQPPTPGAQQTAAAAPRGASRPARAAAAPEAAAPAPAQPAPAQAAPSPPTPAPPTPPVEQPLQVTETAQPTQTFVLPPPTPPQVQLLAPQVQWQPPAARVREVETVQTQQPVAVQHVAPRAVDLPAPAAPPSQVRQREIPNPEPVPQVQAPALQALRSPEAAPVQLPASAPAQARVREIPMPAAPAPAAPAQSVAEAASSAANAGSPQAQQGQAERASQAAAETGQQASTTAANSGAPPSPVQGGQTAGSQASSPGAGARAADEWGTPGPKRADDWGASRSAQAGNQGSAGQGLQGLFNADGSVKVPESSGSGRSDRPGAPGSRQQAKIDANNAGTWLDRPAFGYEPTMFDKYWMPGGTLLQDWVRAGIQDLEIPIPGTSKRIKCVVSILQAGGACGVYDPNLNDHPATARPPPDIPVKRNPIPVGS
jgi:hypothetical protein